MSQSYDWKQLIESKPRELVFKDAPACKHIEEENGLNEIIFKLRSLNFLEISGTPLTCFPDKVANLANLTNLILRNNKLSHLPPDIGRLNKLKFIDVSNNCLEKIPDEIGNLLELQSLVANVNKLTTLPESLKNLTNLTIVKVEFNSMEQFPESICDENLKHHLAEIHAKNNSIQYIPQTIGKLSALKVLDLTENAINDVPGELGDCNRLKEIHLKGNKLTDRKLLKLVDQGKMKQIIDYIRGHCIKGGAPKGNDTTLKETFADAKARVREARRRRRSSSRSSLEDKEASMDTIKILNVAPNEFRLVTATPIILETRKIVCCIVRNVDLTRDGMVKKFLSLQSDLHDGLLCGKRKNATIASHDLAKITGNIVFDLRPPSKIRIHALGRHEMSAGELYKNLNDEAENYRKEKKRNAYSGIHKYLLLLKGKSRFPCLTDAAATVISFPPITNSENTKISEETKDLFLEVTGESQPTCKKVMDSLIHGMLKLGLGADCKDKNDAPLPNTLQLEPVKVVDPEGKLYVVYPSKVDLIFDDIKLTRD